MFENFGELEITVRPKQKINKKLEKNILDIEAGAEMLYLNSNDFDELNKQLLANETVNINKIKKVRQNENGNIVYC